MSKRAKNRNWTEKCPVEVRLRLGEGGQQRLSLLEVGGVKPLSEPGISRRQECRCFSALALVLPEATETHRRSQFQGFGLLAMGDRESFVETGLCLRCRRRRQGKYALTLQTIQFRQRVVIAGRVRLHSGLCQEA